MGYVNAPIDLMKRLNYLKTSGPSQFVSLAIENFLTKELDGHRDKITSLLREKRDAMISSLGENFGGLDVTWTLPEGGCYLWITFSEKVDMSTLQQECFDEGVGYISGDKFSPSGKSGTNSARLCFAYESPEMNREGISKFAEILRRKKVI
jgi:2-aminoadipate transaminase